ncbi:GerMN domain-containing protein [Thermosynechococcus sp. JY1334]|uniref:GerMN domain-containing protein n=1 Tax=unclassified Thermosynechococcus TaxID=2622553 RepID=UPI00267308E6|nr:MULTISPECIES: GerMN domain-containing protein [unclassified Thermosynechococcus]MDR7899110.1 GerMN domain-containing protein [Thermosynechococcus sp. JY1332]MDR7906517.1 GerMN domain-containing protein [Thermosynechococcus sp. JY1334]MDR7994335.1 GerMN domain-containing protein [Thermosynechococcus sp. TG252]WKT86233.1 GerMN domain-containing protein [Thermosynechococcus sp. JY1339]WNC55178.1 GerMN domain-containing protein [Thermosynechococcus sp. JY1331]
MVAKVTRSRPALIVLAVIGLASAGTAAWLTLSPPRQGDPVPNPAEVAQQQETQIFWVKNEGDSLVLVPSTVRINTPTTRPELFIQSRLERLLAGPANQDVTTSIPENTRVNRVEVKADGIHVDLSPEFTKGGGSASMQARLGQVLYTATVNDPNAPVWISIGGEPLRVLGGEGLEVTQPMTRQYFQTAFALRTQ